MAEQQGRKATAREHAIGRVRELTLRNDAAGEYARRLTNAVGAVGAMDRVTVLVMEAVIEAVQIFEKFAGSAVALEARDARIAMESRRYPNGEVQLDGAGDLVSVRFDCPALATFEVPS